MNKGQKVIAAVLGLIAVELLPVSVVATRMLIDGVEVTYEVEDEQLDELEAELSEAERQAEKDMKEGE